MLFMRSNLIHQRELPFFQAVFCVTSFFAFFPIFHLRDRAHKRQESQVPAFMQKKEKAFYRFSKL
jgi:hypothetical protein